MHSIFAKDASDRFLKDQNVQKTHTCYCIEPIRCCSNIVADACIYRDRVSGDEIESPRNQITQENRKNTYGKSKTHPPKHSHLQKQTRRPFSQQRHSITRNKTLPYRTSHQSIAFSMSTGTAPHKLHFKLLRSQRTGLRRETPRVKKTRPVNSTQVPWPLLPWIRYPGVVK